MEGAGGPLHSTELYFTWVPLQNSEMLPIQAIKGL